MAEQNQKYLDYLDKEMTIMGILSTFAVAIVALFLQQIGSAEKEKQVLFYCLWTKEAWYILAGSASILLAAGFFYLQRAVLARHYGLLARAADIGGISAIQARRGLSKKADSWRHISPIFGPSNSFGLDFCYIFGRL